jgi:predicted aspartyl protease
MGTDACTAEQTGSLDAALLLGACKMQQQRTDASLMLNRNNIRFDPAKYKEACELAGHTPTLDACAAADGSNALTNKWCADGSFLQYDCSGQTVWLDPPEHQTQAYLEHYHKCKAKQPAATAAIVVVSRPQAKSLHRFLGGMRLIAQLRAGTVLYTATRGSTPVVGMPHTTQVYVDAPCCLNASRLLVEHEGDPQKETITIDGDRSCLHFTGKVSGAAARIDLDTGATNQFMSERFARKNGLAVQPASRAVALADGKAVRVIGICRARVKIGPLTDVVTFYVLPLNAVYDVLLGEEWLTKRQAILNFRENSLTVQLTKDAANGSGSSVTIAASSAVGGSPSGGEEYPDRPQGEKCLLSALQFKRHMRNSGIPGCSAPC